MFIDWIPQLVALLDKPCASRVQGLVARLADTYPNALQYPIMISAPQLVQSSPETRAFVERIQARVVTPLATSFVRALQSLHHPHLLVSDFFTDIFPQVIGHPTWDAARRDLLCALGMQNDISRTLPLDGQSHAWDILVAC